MGVSPMFLRLLQILLKSRWVNNKTNLRVFNVTFFKKLY